MYAVAKSENKGRYSGIVPWRILYGVVIVFGRCVVGKRFYLTYMFDRKPPVFEW